MSKVSVIIPVYNTKKYLRKCVDSVLAQTYDNLEIILVNDGSTDDSGALCDEIAKGFNNIMVIHKENGGLSDARNVGIAVATGEYTCFLDSDDWMDEDCIEEALNEINSSNADVVVWGYHTDFYDENERVTSSRDVIPTQFRSTDGIDENMDVDKLIGLCGYAWNKLYKTEIIKNIEFAKGISLVEDILFNAEVMTENVKVSFINKAFIHYIQRKRETLGTKYYPDYLELKIMAIKADEKILNCWKASKEILDRFVNSMYLSVSWSMLTNLLKSNASKKEKANKIKELINNKEIISKISKARDNTLNKKISKKTILTKNTFIIKTIINILEKSKGFVSAITPETKSIILSKISSSKNQNWLKYKSDRKKVFIFLAGFYANLGDLAITYAQREFLKEMYPDRDIILVPSTETYASMKTLKKIISKDDVITIIGGGNMSDLYWSLESARLFVIKNFKNNKIISFPQTVSFSDTEKGQKCLNTSRKVYSKHKDIVFFLRENNAYTRFKKYFPTVKCELCPDMVLSLKKTEPRMERNQVVCCLRNDGESYITGAQRKSVITQMRSNFDNVVLRDTVDVSVDECTEAVFEETLNNFWSMLCSSKVVVTDRLHCMIFCVITGTPCVAIDNSNKKISGVYNEWLGEIDWVKFATDSDIDNISALAKEVAEKTNNILPNSIRAKFSNLENACK